MEPVEKCGRRQSCRELAAKIDFVTSIVSSLQFNSIRFAPPQRGENAYTRLPRSPCTELLLDEVLEDSVRASVLLGDGVLNMNGDTAILVDRELESPLWFLGRLRVLDYWQLTMPHCDMRTLHSHDAQASRNADPADGEVGVYPASWTPPVGRRWARCPPGI